MRSRSRRSTPRSGPTRRLRARFRREAVAAAAVAHPNIVATYDTGEDDGVAYIVMELVSGMTLRALIDAEGSLALGRAANITYQVADALSVAHARGLIHRDVKPGNVLVQPNDQVKVTDFGIAKAADNAGDELTRTGMVVGTARYLAPEQVNGDAVDARSDVYSLGLVLYEMLAGHAPFAADTDIATAVARLTSPPRPVSLERTDVPPAFEQVLDRALALDPADRWPSALAFRDAMAPLRSNDTPLTAVVTTVSSPDPTMPVRVQPRAAVPVETEPARSARGANTSLARVLIWIIVFAVGAAGGYLGYRELTKSDPVAVVTPAPKPAPLPIVAVKDYDPEGDRGENPSQVNAAIDKNTATFWSTESYRQRDVGGLKRGVGLVLDLGTTPTVTAVRVQTPDAGWSAEVYNADGVPATLAGWGAPVARGTDLGSDATFQAAPARRARYVLLWITNLPPQQPFRLRVAEVTVIGTP